MRCESIVTGGFPYGNYPQESPALTLARALGVAHHVRNGYITQTTEKVEDGDQEILNPNRNWVLDLCVGNTQQSIGFSTQKTSAWRQR